MPTDHRMVLGELIGEGAKRHFWYGKERSTWSITAEKEGIVKEGNSHFNYLKRMVKKPSQRERTTTAPWISDATWRLADHKVALGRKLTAHQGERRMLTRRFQAAFK